MVGAVERTGGGGFAGEHHEFRGTDRAGLPDSGGDYVAVLRWRAVDLGVRHA